MLAQLGHLVRAIVRGLVRFYYPDIEVSGGARIPAEGPVLLVANHANSLLDPVIVGITVRRPVHFLAKAPLFKIAGFGAVLRALGMLPAYRGTDDRSQVARNLDSISAAADDLVQGEAVGIFPEGRSHDLLQVAQVKSGAARIAAQAVRKGAHGLKVVPLGINFQRKERFRSAVWVCVGQPLDAASVLAAHGGDEHKAIRALTQEIDRCLKAVVIHLESPELEPFLHDLQALLPAPRRRGPPSLAALRQRKRMADAMNWFLAQEPARAAEVTGQIQRYRAHLEAAGLEMASPVMRFRRGRMLWQMLWEGLRLAGGFVPALVGTLHHLLPFLIERAVAGRLHSQSRVDVALTRLGVGLPIYGVWYAAVWLAMRSYFLPWVAWTWSALMPFAGLWAVRYSRRLREGCRGWYGQVRLFFRSGQLKELRAEQASLRERLRAMAEENARQNPGAKVVSPPFSWRYARRVTLRWALILMAVGAVFVWQSAWFRPKPPLVAASQGLNLAGLSSQSVASLLDADETALRDILKGLDELEKRARQMPAEFAAGQRSWYRQADNDAVRQLLLVYVNYRAALSRLIWKYVHWADVRDERLRLRALLAGFTAASALYDSSLRFVVLFEEAPEAIRKLNEAEPLWSIPPGLYDTVKRSLAQPAHRRLMARAQAHYDSLRANFVKHGLSAGPPYEGFHAAIARSAETRQRLLDKVGRAGLTPPLDDAHDAGQSAVYHAQSLISAWIGDTKIRAPRQGEPLIRPEQVEEIRKKLKPGDVLLERRNWFLSNAFLPGYWPHSAIYVGTAADLKALGLDQDARVQRHWEAFVRRDAKGREHVIIESVSEGVVFTSLEHSVGEADAAAFLRPRLGADQIREAMARAFSHVGKPYDFEFDFFSTDKLVCTELVFRSYDGAIQFPLVEIMGTKTMPAIELVRKFAEERGRTEAQFDFVAFLDGDERKGTARFRDAEAFAGTLHRPALTWLQGL